MSCNVQQKIQCIFKSMVIDQPSKKRDGQDYRVVASETIRPEAQDSDLGNALPTEKLDGTCCFVKEYLGRPWLWARHEKKMTKECEKQYKQYLTERRMRQAAGDRHDEISFPFDMTKDFKDTPDEWIPSSNVETIDGIPQPDSNGHIPGWIPVHQSSRQHCWHLTAVDLEKGLALVLRSDRNIHPGLEITAVPLSDLVGRTLELIGTHINANPYGLGHKKMPQHYLVVHGSMGCTDVPRVDFKQLQDWFTHSEYAGMEGIVWHCSNGTMYKIHRHHVGLTWPISAPLLSQQPCVINIDIDYGPFSTYSQFYKLSHLESRISTLRSPRTCW